MVDAFRAFCSTSTFAHVIVILQHKTGLPISTYFSAVKLRWLMDNVDKVHEAVVSHRAMFGTVDSWLIWVITQKSYLSSCNRNCYNIIVIADVHIMKFC